MVPMKRALLCSIVAISILPSASAQTDLANDQELFAASYCLGSAQKLAKVSPILLGNPEYDIPVKGARTFAADRLTAYLRARGLMSKEVRGDQALKGVEIATMAGTADQTLCEEQVNRCSTGSQCAKSDTASDCIKKCSQLESACVNVWRCSSTDRLPF